MISFLLEEGALTVGVMSGIFTTGLLNSLKSNIVYPLTEKIAPTHTLEQKISEKAQESDKSSFVDMFPMPTGSQERCKTNICWKVFLRDFMVWIVLMIILYVFWKYVLGPFRPPKGTIN